MIISKSACPVLPGHCMVPQHILQQLCISKVDDPEDGSKALVSHSRASRRAVHFIQNSKQSFDEALCQLRVLLHQLGSSVFSTVFLVTPWRWSEQVFNWVPQSYCNSGISAFTQWRGCIIHLRHRLDDSYPIQGKHIFQITKWQCTNQSPVYYFCYENGPVLKIWLINLIWLQLQASIQQHAKTLDISLHFG